MKSNDHKNKKILCKTQDRKTTGRGTKFTLSKIRITICLIATNMLNSWITKICIVHHIYIILRILNTIGEYNTNKSLIYSEDQL